MPTDLLIRRANIREIKFEDVETIEELRPNQLRLKIDQFAFTANNITYAATGEMLKYWDFFPASDGWGKVPVWGFADVEQSNHPDITVGERIYGYFPLATHLIVDADRVSPYGFRDGAAHRQHLNGVYNQYVRTTNTPGFAPEIEHLNALLRPLFTTSFLIDDFLYDNGFFDAEAVVISSASSKTAFGTAFQLHANREARGSDVQVIGLTSAGNVAFVEGLGCYDRVVAYEDVEADISAETTIAYIDIAGNGKLRSRVHHHFTDNIKYSGAVGASHWETPPWGRGLPGIQPTFFFAPSQVQKRNRDWGRQQFQQRLAAAWLNFLKLASGAIKINVRTGQDAVAETYTQMLEGRSNPSDAFILSL